MKRTVYIVVKNTIAPGRFLEYLVIAVFDKEASAIQRAKDLQRVEKSPEPRYEVIEADYFGR